MGIWASQSRVTAGYRFGRVALAMLLAATAGLLSRPAAAQDSEDKGGAPCITVTRSFPQAAFSSPQSGFQVTVTITSTCDEVYAIGLRENLPDGWTFESILGTSPDVPTWNTEVPAVGGIVEFAWFPVPDFPFPIEFTYLVSIPEGVSDSRQITGDALYRVLDGPQEISASVSTALFSQPPVITLEGDSLVILNCGEDYAEPGYTATDPIEGDLTGDVLVAGNIDNREAGDYILLYSVSNSFGKGDVKQRTVRVLDQEPPFTTLLGEEFIELECSSTPFNDPGATAIDVCQGPVTPERSGTFNSAVPGTYVLSYTATDAGGNVSNTVTRTIVVSDTRLPTLALIGAASITVECGTAYTELGATATDFCDGDITDNIAINASNVNASRVGTYTVTYNVLDSTGNRATPLSRTVVVSDTAQPNITLIGASALTLQCGTTYVDLGATASDACAGALPVEVDTTQLNMNAPGTYTVRYRARDGRTATKVLGRTITVVDGELPKITLNGDAVTVIECGSTYTEAGVEVTDNCDTGLEAEISSNVDSEKPGSYRVTYSIEDSSGNKTEASRLVIVEDSTAPAVALLGSDNIVLECSNAFSDPGATATDTCDGDLTANIVVGGERVIISEPGEYVLTYTATDSAGNVSAAASRTVTVVDSELATIRLNGGNETLNCGDDFIDFGATASDRCDGDLTTSIVVTGADIDTTVPGAYTVTYSVTDAGGNLARVERLVTVRDAGCETEGEGEGTEEGEGEGVVETPECPLDSVTILDPLSNVIVPAGTPLATVRLRSAVALDSAEDCVVPESITMLYSIDGVLVGSSTNKDAGFPVDVELGRGTYVLAATAVPEDQSGAVAAVRTFSVLTAVDNDGNGILDNPFLNMPGNGDFWQASVNTEGGCARAVVMRSWTVEGDGDVTATVVNPDNSNQVFFVSVERDVLAVGEQGILIVSMSCDLASLFDPYPVGAVVDKLPAGPIAGEAFIDVSILVTPDGGATYHHLETPDIEGVSYANITYESDSLGRGATFRKYPSIVESGVTGLELTPGNGAWNKGGIANVLSATRRIRAELSSFSTLGLFVAVDLPAEISSDTQTLNFGSLVQSGTRDRNVTVQNLGDAILSGTATVNGNGFSLVSGGTYELESGETATVTVRFAPGSVATFSGTLVLNGGDGGTINVALSGVGTLTDKGDSATGCGSAPGANGGPMADLLLVGGVLALLALAARKRMA